MSPFEIVMLVIHLIRLVLDLCIHRNKERKARKAQRLAQESTVLFILRVKRMPPHRIAERTSAGEQAASAEHIMQIIDQMEPAPEKKAG